MTPNSSRSCLVLIVVTVVLYIMVLIAVKNRQQPILLSSTSPDQMVSWLKNLDGKATAKRDFLVESEYSNKKFVWDGIVQDVKYSPRTYNVFIWDIQAGTQENILHVHLETIRSTEVHRLSIDADIGDKVKFEGIFYALSDNYLMLKEGRILKLESPQ